MSENRELPGRNSQLLSDDKAAAVTGGASKAPWVKRFCPNCGKDRNMNADAYGGYVCVVCKKKFTFNSSAGDKK